MTKLILSFILLILVTACGDGFEKEKVKNDPTQEGLEVDTFIVNQDYLLMVNEHRVSLGLRPLNYHFIVEEVAKSHSKGMALHTRTFGHMGFSVRCRRLKNRLGKIHKCGELVGMRQKNIHAVFKSWMSEPKHRQEIEQSKYTHTGLGIYKDESGVLYWTQMFVQL
jgi:uncharacterized protein YkwD